MKNLKNFKRFSANLKENLVKFSEIIAKILRKVLVDIVRFSERGKMLN